MRRKETMTRIRTWIPAVTAGAALVLALTAPACGGGAGSAAADPAGTSLNGAGSTLVYPLLSQWEPDYSSKTGATITYGAIGSGGGIAAVTSRSVDFGASDAPLTDDQRRSAGDVIQIPWALAATDVAYHVKGIGDKLKLTGPVLADIFLGKVATWDDPAIARLNPGVHLPATKITPVYRSDASGDTYVFTDYLSKISSAWKSTVGSAVQVSFPTGVGAEHNSGVAAALAGTDGTIAYLAISYVLQNSLDYALLRNAAGNYPDVQISAISAAAATVKSIPAGGAVSVTNPPASAAEAYPMATFSYVIVPASSPKATALRKFITYAITDGQQFAAALDFAPLPEVVRRYDEQQIALIGRG
jgi:phosphate transport system substrate-binding protein